MPSLVHNFDISGLCPQCNTTFESLSTTTTTHKREDVDLKVSIKYFYIHSSCSSVCCLTGCLGSSTWVSKTRLKPLSPIPEDRPGAAGKAKADANGKGHGSAHGDTPIRYIIWLGNFSVWLHWVWLIVCGLELLAAALQPCSLTSLLAAPHRMRCWVELIDAFIVA